MKHVGKLMLAALVVAQLSGCATLERVKPWERGTLAKKEMALNSAGLDNALDDHIYFSKEGSSGGRSFAGGGCGCN
ncbi:MAG: DUF4266 domain-containing protein [Gammaproteobacteria bacterium]|mgnify:FL=1|jgi:uncharacterized lipoprotein|nr:DUF4266 domain-containing protein [Gammaproteobacteria bacterium]